MDTEQQEGREDAPTPPPKKITVEENGAHMPYTWHAKMTRKYFIFMSIPCILINVYCYIVNPQSANDDYSRSAI